MQKAHSNINWENLPSKNTPLGAYLLNKQDREIDVIDDRVLALYGYQDRVAQSEKNAKASETNAKTSETNAKQSELKAKEYAEHAFSGTPEGYEQLVEDVRLMDIQTTTDTTLANSKAGGYKLLSMSGKSVQKTTTGKNLFSAKMIQGVISSSSGAFGESTTVVCSDDFIEIEPSLTYTLSRNVSTGIITLRGYDADKNFVGNGGTILELVEGNTVDSPMNTGETSCTIKFLEGVSFFKINDYSNDLTIQYQLEIGTVATEYEPYTNGASPNPDYPRSIENVGDCVEMMQGGPAYNTGIYANVNYKVSNKRPIPCKANDVIAFSLEKIPEEFVVVYYTDDGYLSFRSNNGVKNPTFTVPSGATKFSFYASDYNGITPDTVGKIELTINGKYVVQFKTNGKNLFDENAIMSGYELVSTSGAITKNTSFCVSDYMPISPSTAFYLTKGDRGASICFYDKDMNYISTVTKTKGVVTSPNNENVVYMRINCALTELEGVQVEVGTVATEYEPYQEKVATVLLNAPLCETDLMSRTEVARKRASKVFNGGENWTIAGESEYGYQTFYVAVSDMAIVEEKDRGNVKSDKFIPSSVSLWSNPTGYYVALGVGEKVIYISVKTTDATNVSELKTWLAENNVEIEYPIEEVIETLDTDSQIALNSLETFDTVTYINVDSRVQPSEIKGEYGTSMVGARTIKNELRNDTLEIKYNELAVALVATESGV